MSKEIKTTLRKIYVTKFCVSLIIFALISCHSDNKKGGPVKSSQIYTDVHLEKIELDYVEMYITTFASIECTEFDNTFLKIKKTKVLNNPNDIVAFNSLLEETLLNDQRTKNLDTRIKGSLYYTDGSVKGICLGLHGLEVEGGIYTITNDFRNYLLKLTVSE